MNAAGLDALRKNSSRSKQIASLLSGLRTNRPIVNFVRVMEKKHLGSAPLGPSRGPSRFSPVYVGGAKQPKLSILYGAADLATASYEKIIRERFDLDPSRILTPADYQTKCAVNFSTPDGQSLTLLDLRGGNAVRSGVPTDVVCYSNHQDGQHFSEFVHRQMPYIDGFLYSSRFTQIDCLGVYDRGLHKLTSGVQPVTLTRSMLDAVLAPWNVAVA